MSDRLLSVVLPVHNQADHVGEIVADYAAVLDRLPARYELILVPNACRDNTAEVCHALAAEWPSIRVAQVIGAGGVWPSAPALRPLAATCFVTPIRPGRRRKTCR